MYRYSHALSGLTLARPVFYVGKEKVQHGHQEVVKTLKKKR